MKKKGKASCLISMAIVAAFLLIVIGSAGVFVWHSFWRPVQSLKDLQGKMEKRLTDAGLYLVQVAGDPQAADGVRSLYFDHATLSTHTLYLKPPNPQGSYIYIDESGLIRTGLGEMTTLKERGELLFTEDGLTLFIDGKWIGVDLADWQIFWASASPTEPVVDTTTCNPVSFADGFMRTKLEEAPWKIERGTWRLNQHGAGMAETDEDAANVHHPRAVNPFSVIGSNNGILSCQLDPLPHLAAEARFYFGIPKTTNVVDTMTLPLGTDIQLMLGDPKGAQAAFGWQGESRTFVLIHRASPDDPWEVIASDFDRRPPLTNWMTLGLHLRNGHHLTALLDGVPIIEAPLPYRLTGPLHIRGGEGLIEVDDVRYASLPLVPEKGTPIHIKSREFAPKELHEDRDSEIFQQWTRAIDTFVQKTTSEEGERLRTIVTRLPLFGTVLYESVPHTAEAGTLPFGLYQFRVIARSEATLKDLMAGDVKLDLRFQYDKLGWHPVDLPAFVWPTDHAEFTLRLKRDEDEGNRLMVQVGGKYVPLGPAVAGPFHLAISRVGERGAYPRADHHAIYSRNLVQELFEEAPTEWNWIEGAFRMDQRWACANMWNLLVGAATGLPALTGKHVYQGDQEHEYFLSLRPAFPWDAGDTTFSYDPTTDEKWAIFISHNGWYNRHNLNFSFCTNGLDPMSGYSVIFAGNENQETMLLRHGKVVASTREHFIPRDESHGVVHWKWWHFHVRKIGPRVQVLLDNEILFDYVDEAPLAGGHTSIWGVRNAFTITRCRSAADAVSREPHFLYVADDAPSAWQPLVTDDVVLEDAGAASTRVTATRGGGFQAVRWRPEAPIDLAVSPWLDLPLELGAGVKVNLHLDIDGKGYLMRINAPLENTKALLTPDFERGEQFQLRPMSEATLRRTRLLGEVEPGPIRVNLGAMLDAMRPLPAKRLLRSITIGNSSNADYLMAGNGGNRARSWYTVGTPRFFAEQTGEDAP